MKKAFLPLGSLIIVKGSTKKLMIISRAIATIVEDKTIYFEYGACLYPEGLIGDKLIYFNHEDIMQIVHEGFINEEDSLMQENIQQAIIQSGLENSKYEYSSITMLFLIVEYKKNDEYLPLIKDYLSVIIDNKQQYWNIHDTIKFLIQYDATFINELLNSKGKTLKDFGL